MAEKKKIKDFRNPTLQIRISPELDERLSEVSSMYGVTKQEIARIAIGQYVGQITGAIDRMSKASKVDYEKLVDLMIPKLIEATENKGFVQMTLSEERNGG